MFSFKVFTYNNFKLTVLFLKFLNYGFRNME